MSRSLALVFSVAFSLTCMDSGSVGAEDWHPSKWGKDDTLGAVNWITPESIVAAASLVKTGKRYALGQVTSRDTPAFGARTFELFAVSHGGVFDGTSTPYGTAKLTTNDDWVLAFLGVGSQTKGQSLISAPTSPVSCPFEWSRTGSTPASKATS